MVCSHRAAWNAFTAGYPVSSRVLSPITRLKRGIYVRGSCIRPPRVSCKTWWRASNRETETFSETNEPCNGQIRRQAAAGTSAKETRCRSEQPLREQGSNHAPCCPTKTQVCTRHVKFTITCGITFGLYYTITSIHLLQESPLAETQVLT